MRDWDAVQRTAERAIAALRTWEAEEALSQASWPSGWCDFASYVVAGALSDSGYGDWDVVWANDPNVTRAHTWIEFVEDGETLYAIDATQHQFADLGDEPYFGPGPAPAASVLISGPRRRRFSDLFWGNGIYTVALEYVREQLCE